MLQLTFISIHPQFLAAYQGFGCFRAAEQKGLAEISVLNLRDFTPFSHGTVDDRPYGGGDGMVLRPEPLTRAIQSLNPKPYVINLSPGGKIFKQSDAQKLLELNQPLAFVCGRFGGIDQRFIDRYVDAEYSIGDFVLSGGELPALCIADALLRLVPGVLGHEQSSLVDSFAVGCHGLLEHPVYTRPENFEGLEVPPVLRSGDHKKIAVWREEQSLQRTQRVRPELLLSRSSDELNAETYK